MTAPYDGGVSIADFHRAVAEHRASHLGSIEEIRLTQGEMDLLKQGVPSVEDGHVAVLLGIPVTIVDRPEDSTLFSLTWDSLVQRLKEERP